MREAPGFLLCGTLLRLCSLRSFNGRRRLSQELALRRLLCNALHLFPRCPALHLGNPVPFRCCRLFCQTLTLRSLECDTLRLFLFSATLRLCGSASLRGRHLFSQTLALRRLLGKALGLFPRGSFRSLHD